MSWSQQFAVEFGILDLDDWCELTACERDELLSYYAELHPGSDVAELMQFDVVDEPDVASAKHVGRPMLSPPKHWQQLSVA